MLIGGRLYQYIMRSMVTNTKALPVNPFRDCEALDDLFTSGSKVTHTTITTIIRNKVQLNSLSGVYINA